MSVCLLNIKVDKYIPYTVLMVELSIHTEDTCIIYVSDTSK